jgi:hypothetical protein
VETDGPNTFLQDTMLLEPATAWLGWLVFQIHHTRISQPTVSPQIATTPTEASEFHHQAHHSSVLLAPLLAAAVATAVASSWAASEAAKATHPSIYRPQAELQVHTSKTSLRTTDKRTLETAVGINHARVIISWKSKELNLTTLFSLPTI